MLGVVDPQDWTDRLEKSKVQAGAPRNRLRNEICIKLQIFNGFCITGGLK